MVRNFKVNKNYRYLPWPKITSQIFLNKSEMASL